jgi:ubiquinone biosynthesis protein UbiJ
MTEIEIVRDDVEQLRAKLWRMKNVELPKPSPKTIEATEHALARSEERLRRLEAEAKP